MVTTTRWLRRAVRARRWLRGLNGIHVLLLATVIVAIWGAILFHMQRDFRRVEANAWRESTNLAFSVEESLLQTFRGIDQSLLFLREVHRRDPGGLNLTAWAANPAWTGGPVLQIGISDANGIMIASNLGLSGRVVDISDRAYFIAQREATADKVLVGEPQLGRLSGRWTVNVTRRLTTVDGRFDGIAMASVDVSYLDRLYAEMHLAGGVLMLFRGDGVVLQRAPIGVDSIGRSAAGPERQIITGGHTGTYRAIDPADKIERMVTFCRIDDFPLVISIGQDVAEVFAEWTLLRRDHLILGGFFTVLSLVVGLLLERQWRRGLSSQAALGATLQNISQGILMVGTDGRIDVMNDQAALLAGVPLDLFHVGARFGDVLEWQLGHGEFGPPEQLDPTFLAFIHGGGLANEFGTYERTRPTGQVLEVRTHLLTDGSAVRTFTDITHRKHTEQALAAARDAAEAAGRARAEFLAVMSHEIRTPMNGIIGVSSLLLEMEMGPSERRYVRIIMDSGRHLLQLINDILDFSRLDAGRLDLEEAVFDMPGLLRGTIDMVSPDAQAKGLELSLEIAADVPQFTVGDGHRLRQILLNLLGNGVKFTRAGRVGLIVRRVSHGSDGLRLGFAVSDTGIGIPTNNIGKLFTEFTQVDSSITRRFGGSGLGLAISRRLVERMGGVIWADSTQGRGSVFHFEITFKQPPEPISASFAADQKDPEPATPGALRILLADDNDTNRLVTTRMLERHGHAVVAVADGREAVDCTQASVFDLILMDVMMPEMDGLAATRAIRQLAAPFGTVPIIGLTASVTAADEAACRDAGMDAFAPKPINASQLAALVTKVGRAPAAAHTDPDGADLDLTALARLDPSTAHAKASGFIAACRRDGHSLQDLADSQQMTQLSQLAREIAVNASELGLAKLALSADWLAATAGAAVPLGSRLADTIACLKSGDVALTRWVSKASVIGANDAL